MAALQGRYLRVIFDSDSGSDIRQSDAPFATLRAATVRRAPSISGERGTVQTIAPSGKRRPLRRGRHVH
jgi:hypothetical protein